MGEPYFGRKPAGQARRPEHEERDETLTWLGGHWDPRASTRRGVSARFPLPSGCRDSARNDGARAPTAVQDGKNFGIAFKRLQSKVASRLAILVLTQRVKSCLPDRK